MSHLIFNLKIKTSTKLRSDYEKYPSFVRRRNGCRVDWRLRPKWYRSLVLDLYINCNNSGREFPRSSIKKT